MAISRQFFWIITIYFQTKPTYFVCLHILNHTIRRLGPCHLRVNPRVVRSQSCTALEQRRVPKSWDSAKLDHWNVPKPTGWWWLEPWNFLNHEFWNNNGLCLSHQIGNFIIPTDELHDFSRGVGWTHQPGFVSHYFSIRYPIGYININLDLATVVGWNHQTDDIPW
jgi:hypothetical protein